jgi:outer membrane protein assembly factor BamA
MISKLRHARCSSRCAITLGLAAAFSLACRESVVAGPQLEVRGNRVLTDDAIGDLLRGWRWDGASDGHLLRAVQEAYIRTGHLFASVRLERNAPDSTLVVFIEEGAAARLDRVKVRGATHFGEDKVRRVLGLEPGDRFRPDTVNRGVEELLEMYDVEGYPFAQVWIDSLHVEPKTSGIALNVYIVEGDEKQLSAVRVEGLGKTNPGVALKLSGLRVGAPYDGASLHDAYVRLSSSGVFEDVAYPIVQISPTGQGVEALIKVVEPRKTNSLTAALGYAQQETRDARAVNGLVRLDLVNIGGRLRDLNVFWRNDGSGRIQTELAFRQQFFLGRRMSLGLSLAQVGQDTVYTWQSMGLESVVPVGKIGSGMLAIEAGVNGDRSTFAEGDVTRSLRLRFTGGVSYMAGRKDRGAFARVAGRLTYADKEMDSKTEGSQSVSQYVVGLDGQAAFELRRNVHVANRTVYQHLISPEAQVPLSEQFYLGGAATVRGYRENQFHSPSVAFSRSELLIGRSRLENGYLFADVGYYEQQEPTASGGVTDAGLVIFGYGAGLRTRSKAGNIDFSLALGEEFSLQRAKIHVVLERTF